MHLVNSVAVFSVLFLLLSFSSRAATNFDPAKPGPFEVASKEYRLEPSDDEDILSDRTTEIWARVFHPKDLTQGPYPVIALLHGNHATCGRGENPRRDQLTDYSRFGTCPDGWVVTPNHEGYNYVASHLASHGYIVFSINANRGITAMFGTEGDWGNNLARGRLVLKHLEYWKTWSTTGGAPESLGLGADGWVGKVDLTHVGLMGHSRGGEGMRAALVQYQDAGSMWQKKIPNLNIEAIFEIGAVDGQTDRVLNAPSVAWNQLIPVCDGDVSTLEGINPYNRMIRDPSEPKTAQKSVTIIYGANHNFFNTEWQVSDATSGHCLHHEPIFSDGEIGSEKQKEVARALMARFFLANVGAKKRPELNDVFNAGSKLTDQLSAITRIDRDFTVSPNGEIQTRIADFSEGESDVRISGTPNVNATLSSAYDSSLPLLEVGWVRGDRTELALDFAQEIDASAAKTMDLRLSLSPAVLLQGDLDFFVNLVDANGVRSAPVALSQIVKKSMNPFRGWLFETVRFPISRFRGVDLKRLKGLHLGFDPASDGRLALANLRLTQAFGPGMVDERVEPHQLPSIQNGSLALRSGPFYFNIVKTDRTRVVGIRESYSPSRLDWGKRRRSPNYAEIVLTSDVKFQIRDALPVLRVGNHELKLSALSPELKQPQITFAIPEKLRQSLRGKTMPVTLSYQGDERRVWDFGSYTF